MSAQGRKNNSTGHTHRQTDRQTDRQTYTHTFEVHAEVHPQPEGVDHSGLNGLSEDSKLSEQHALGAYHVVPLYQLLQELFRCCEGLVREEESLDKFHVCEKGGRGGCEGGEGVREGLTMISATCDLLNKFVEGGPNDNASSPVMPDVLFCVWTLVPNIYICVCYM